MSVKSEKPPETENFHDYGKICYNGGSGAGRPQEGAGCLKSGISIQERLKDLRGGGAAFEFDGAVSRHRHFKIGAGRL